MPDLRDDLGRLADFVGEPRGLDDLAAARRRRERRRRTEGLIGGAGVFIVALLIAFALRDQSDGALIPGTTSSPPVSASGAPLTVWPENAINGASASKTQAALDAGDDSLQWRTDPEQVVQRFGSQILGRTMSTVSIGSTPDGASVTTWPCPAGVEPGPLSCDSLDGDPLTLRLVQPAMQGADGIWSVESVISSPLSVAVDANANEGDEVSFNLPQIFDATSAHFGIVASNGCNVVTNPKDAHLGGNRILVIPELYQASPSCAAPAGGYAYAYVTDNTTLPSPDPINEPTAIEYPWITIVPFSLPPSPIVQPTPSVQSVSSPDGIQYCDGNPATRIVILERDISLVGCLAWAADVHVDLTLQNRDEGVPVGLALSRPSDCDEYGCSGDPIWSSDLITGIDNKSFAIDPLPAGHYVLWDVVHPMSRLDIVVK